MLSDAELSLMKQSLVVAGVAGGFLGGMIGQLMAGAWYLRKIMRVRCSNHAGRLEQLERRAIGNAPS